MADLSRMHDKSATHNDLKPSNIIFNPVTQKMYIIDFGCAEDIVILIKLKEKQTPKEGEFLMQVDEIINNSLFAEGASGFFTKIKNRSLVSYLEG